MSPEHLLAVSNNGNVMLYNDINFVFILTGFA